MSGKDKEKDKEREVNSVFVGRRPTMNYVMATMMILNKGEDCTVKARGRAISHAVDVCEILRNRFLKGIKQTMCQALKLYLLHQNKQMIFKLSEYSN